MVRANECLNFNNAMRYTVIELRFGLKFGMNNLVADFTI